MCRNMGEQAEEDQISAQEKGQLCPLLNISFLGLRNALA